MKKRILNWLYHKIHRYTPGTSKLADSEAKRYCQYITESYNEIEQLIILKNLKAHLEEYRENQIKNKELLIIQTEDSIKILNTNLEKIKEI